MEPINYFEIGKIVNTQGIKGDVRVVPMTDDKTRFELLESVLVRINETKLLEIPIERVWYHKNFVMLKLQGVDDINAADQLRGGVIVVSPELALPLDDGEYYLRDLLDMKIVTTDGEELGIITEVLQTGANDVFVVKKEGCKDLLIPHIKKCVISVDVAGKTMLVKLLEGLR